MSPVILVRSRRIALGGVVATAAALALWQGPAYGLGTLASGLWAVASLRTLEGLLLAAVVPADRERDTSRIIRWGIAKIGVYAVAICALIVRPFPAGSLLAGVSWLPLSLVVAGLMPAPRQDSNATSRG